MGNYEITIRGTGSHHNQLSAVDADRIARTAVEELDAAGHRRLEARIKIEGSNDSEDLMLPPARPGEANFDTLLARFPILKYFRFGHLPEKLQAIARPFERAAWLMANRLPATAETSAGLRKLLEAKDCCVRAAQRSPHPPWKDPQRGGPGDLPRLGATRPGIMPLYESVIGSFRPLFGSRW